VAEPGARIVHHELCFGCGQANLFGLQLEVSAQEGGGVAGRFFVKQDHQGPPGFAHGGVLAAALDETMALLLHGRDILALTARLELELLAPAPIGAFVDVKATIAEEQGRKLLLGAEANAEDGGETLAQARGIFVRRT
jgi:acyl-coenzyme A thioesterase PaaI-like protein